MRGRGAGGGGGAVKTLRENTIHTDSSRGAFSVIIFIFLISPRLDSSVYRQTLLLNFTTAYVFAAPEWAVPSRSRADSLSKMEFNDEVAARYVFLPVEGQGSLLAMVREAKGLPSRRTSTPQRIGGAL